MYTVLSLSDRRPVASITIRAHQPVWDEWYRPPQCHGKLGGDGWQIHSSWEKTHFDKRGASPRPLKHGQDKQGRLHLATRCCPCHGKLHSVPSRVCNQLLPPLCRALPFTKSLLCLPWVPEGWTVCTEYQEATLHKTEQILSNLQRGRFTGDSTQQFAKSETRSR